MGMDNMLMFCSTDESRIHELITYAKGLLPMYGKTKGRVPNICIDDVCDYGSVQGAHYCLIGMRNTDVSELCHLMKEEGFSDLLDGVLILFKFNSPDDLYVYEDDKYLSVGDCWQEILNQESHEGYLLEPLLEVFVKHLWK